MLDIFLGPVDGEFLQSETLAPEKHLWWNCGLDWIKHLVRNEADQRAKHPGDDLDEVAERPVSLAIFDFWQCQSSNAAFSQPRRYFPFSIALSKPKILHNIGCMFQVGSGRHFEAPWTHLMY